MADVFISYNQKDRELAKILVRSLEEAGLSVWWDQRIRATATWDEVIEREIEAAGAVVVLWTPASFESKFVRSEATYAEQRGKYLGVMVKDTQLPLAFQLIQTISLPHLAIQQGNLAMHPRFSELVNEARNIAKSAGVYRQQAAEAAQRNTRKRARQQFLTNAIFVLILGGAAAGGGYWWWNEQQNTRKAQVTALGAGLGLGQLKAQRTDATWLGDTAPPTIRDSTEAPPCTRGEGGEPPCTIAWVREVAAGTGGIPELAPRIGAGASLSMETKTVAISGTTDHRVFAGGKPVDFDFTACAQNGACGITAVSGPRPGSMYDSSSIDVGMADGSVVRVYSNGTPFRVIDPPYPDSSVTVLGETGDAQLVLRANGQLLVGLPEQRDVGSGIITTVIRHTEANLGEWIARDGAPACPEGAPLARTAQATRGGLGVVAISCDGLLVQLSRASSADPFSFDRKDYVSGRKAAGLSRAGNFLLFGPDAEGGGVTVFDPHSRTVLDFDNSIDGDVVNIRGRLAAVVLTRAGEVILREPSAKTDLATVPLVGAEETATPHSDDRVEISPTGITIRFTIDGKPSGWRLTDPGGPLINE